jgi:hypothetical protein
MQVARENFFTMGRWDSFSKLLIGLRPWQYVHWLIAGAELVEVLNVELNAQAFLADALLKISINGQLALLHIEFQSYEDPTMGARMLKYNILAVKHPQKRVRNSLSSHFSQYLK